MKMLLRIIDGLFFYHYEVEEWVREWDSEEDRARFVKYFRFCNNR